MCDPGYTGPDCSEEAAIDCMLSTWRQVVPCPAKCGHRVEVRYVRSSGHNCPDENSPVRRRNVSCMCEGDLTTTKAVTSSMIAIATTTARGPIQYAFSERHENNCPYGSRRIVLEADCSSAAVGLGFSWRKVELAPEYPAGCYVRHKSRLPQHARNRQGRVAFSAIVHEGRHGSIELHLHKCGLPHGGG